MWLTNRKAEWRALRKRRRSLAGEQSRLVQKVIEEKNLQLAKKTVQQVPRKKRLAREVTDVFAVPQDNTVSHLACVLIL